MASEGQKNRRRRLTPRRKAKENRPASAYAFVGGRAIRRRILGRRHLSALREEHEAKAYERGQSQLINLRRGYEAHVEAEQRRARAGIDRKLRRAYRPPV